MFGIKTDALIDIKEQHFTVEDYQSNESRWCPGCGDNAILAATQKLCRDLQLPPEKTVFVSGIGCAARFPHYMNTYGFHGLHGRAFPIAEGVKIRRPDLDVFVNTGDGDCCSIGTAHWIHAVRYNMNMVAVLHDNGVYGLTKKQASPTSPRGLKSNTTPRGAFLEPLNPTMTTLGIQNVSFVAQAVEWLPEPLYDILLKAYQHKGFSFIRVLQRCPHFMQGMLDPLMSDPNNILMLTHDKGLQLSDAMGKIYKNQEAHDPSNMDKAREYAGLTDKFAVGVLYRNEDVPCYEDLRKPARVFTPDMKREALEHEFDKFGINPQSTTNGAERENHR